MPINPDAVGAESEPVEVHWDSNDALLYAVGVGAGTDELAYTTENTRGVDQQVLPTFPVVVGFGRAMGAMAKIGSFNPAMLVHGQQSVTLHHPLPVTASVTIRSKVTGIYDKGKAAVVVTQADAVDAAGVALYTTTMSAFIRGEGGWGGDRGPAGPLTTPPDRAPDHRVTYDTLVTQALIYRLSGDRNPLHSDPAFAALGGFDRPILHGLCTYGFTGRALLHSLCNSTSARFRHMEGRFSSPVVPGESLTVSIWRTGRGEAVFTTAVGDRVVIDQGTCRFEECARA
jgi:acyl dehydratase